MEENHRKKSYVGPSNKIGNVEIYLIWQPTCAVRVHDSFGVVIREVKSVSEEKIRLGKQKKINSILKS